VKKSIAIVQYLTSTAMSAMTTRRGGDLAKEQCPGWMVGGGVVTANVGTLARQTGSDLMVHGSPEVEIFEAIGQSVRHSDCQSVSRQSVSQSVE
jgi:copper homeostasis protein CutC